MTRGPALRVASAVAVAAVTALLLAGCGVPGAADALGPGSTSAADSPTAPDSPTGSSALEPTAPEPGASEPVASDLPGNALAEQLLGRGFATAGPADVTGYDLVRGSQLTLAFYRDHQNAYGFGGSVGCNSMGGAAAWDGDTVRAADGLVQTEMACEGLMDQEAWWAGLLTAGMTLTLDGHTLTVTAEGDKGPVTIRMTESAAQHPSGQNVDPTVKNPDEPMSSPELLAGDGFVVGHTYRLTRLFTDAGGGDTRFDNARFSITFAATGATAESQCGTIEYRTVRFYDEGGVHMVDLGQPTGPACSLGTDPSGVPSGPLMMGCADGECYLSTGFVAWYFKPMA